MLLLILLLVLILLLLRIWKTVIDIWSLECTIIYIIYYVAIIYVKPTLVNKWTIIIVTVIPMMRGGKEVVLLLLKLILIW